MRARKVHSGFMLIIGVTALLICFVTIVILSGRLNAGYGTPENRDAAIQRVNWLCSQGSTIAHAAWVSHISQVNTADGSLSYDINVIWRRCVDGVDTRAFAVTGYPTNETAVCPEVGTYGINSAPTYDCVKYIGNPEYGQGSGLTCTSGSDANCVNGAFNSIKVSKNQPNTGFMPDQERHLNREAVVPDWQTRYRSTETSYTFRIPNALCVYLKSNPYDGGRGGINCQDIIFTAYWQGPYTLTPSVKDMPSIVDGDTTSATGTIDNNGVTAPGTTYWVMKLLAAPSGVIPSRWNQLASESSDEEPCRFYGGAGVSCDQLSEASGAIDSSGMRRAQPVVGIDRYPVGTRLCVTLSVRARARDDSRWQHALQCTTVAKKPKIQVLGSDINVQKRSGAQDGSVTTSTTFNGGKWYGSWGEYGVMASGRITGMASAAGLAGGSAMSPASCTVYLLTFSNAGPGQACKPPGSQGGFIKTGSGERLADSFKAEYTVATPVFDISTAMPGVYAATRDVTLIATRPISAGRWVVIKAPAHTVAIESDIRYSTQALIKVSDMPQVLLFAGAISVAAPVQHIDAWLVASSSVSTCSAVRSQADLTARLCDLPLRINGPIMTSQLLLNRTAGAGVGNRSGDPAEVFNLRADAYLWLHDHFSSKSKIRTVYQKELPPRF